MRELFIYYRIRAAEANAARQTALALQAQLVARHPHLVARLLRRPDEQDGLQTWMETYATDPMHDRSGVSTELQRDIEAQAAALLCFIEGKRHIEVFESCAS